MAKTSVKQISTKLEEFNQKVNSLLVKQRAPTKAELKVIREGEEQISKGQYITLEELKRKVK